MVYTFIITVIVAFMINLFVVLTGATTFLEILEISMLLAFGFIVTVKFTDMLYTVGKPFWSIQAQKLFFVTSGYYIAMFLAMSVTLYYFG